MLERNGFQLYCWKSKNPKPSCIQKQTNQKFRCPETPNQLQKRNCEAIKFYKGKCHKNQQQKKTPGATKSTRRNMDKQPGTPAAHPLNPQEFQTLPTREGECDIQNRPLKNKIKIK
jgi:hypothetical protein